MFYSLTSGFLSLIHQPYIDVSTVHVLIFLGPLGETVARKDSKKKLNIFISLSVTVNPTCRITYLFHAAVRSTISCSTPLNILAIKVK